MDKYDFFNFPIPILKGFLMDPNKVLYDIFDYAIFREANSLSVAKHDAIRQAGKNFNVSIGDINKTYNNGKKLYYEYSGKPLPMTGINREVFFKYYENEKTEFEFVCLLALLAFKSMLGNKAFMKVTNKFWFSRMAGNPKAVRESEDLPDELQKYSKRYWIDKIKTDLRINWGLVIYSKSNRGFYISKNLTLDKLAYEAESKKIINKAYQLKEAQNQAYLKARALLTGKEFPP
jgi:hypothetical protein